VSGITCSSSGGPVRATHGIFHACYVSWLNQDDATNWQHARNIPSAVCEAPPEDEQVMLETCGGPLSLINRIRSASRRFHYTEEMHICSRAADIQRGRNFHLLQSTVSDTTPTACPCVSLISEPAWWEMQSVSMFICSLIRRNIFRDGDSSISNFGLEADIFRVFDKSSMANSGFTCEIWSWPLHSTSLTYPVTWRYVVWITNSIVK
jgi:hypothetical protein